MTKKTEKFIEKVEKKYPGRYQILSEYQATRTKISVKCLICNDVREVTPDNLLQNGSCKVCGEQKRIESRTASKEEFIEELKQNRGEDYTLIGAYKNKKTKALFRHKCGGIHKMTPQAILIKQTKGCPTCMGGVAMPETLIKKRFEEKAEGEYVLHGKYEGIDKKMDVEHLTCGTVWEVSMENFLNRGTRCPKCANKKTEATFLKEFKKYSKGEWDLLSKYKGIQEYVFVKHKVCGRRRFVKPGAMKTRKGIYCQHCGASSISQKEKDLLSFIEDSYSKEIILNSKKIIEPYELDIYLPELKLAFEFNGLYWHCEEKKGSDYHTKKTELCEARGIQLIHILESDWEQKQEIVKSKILNLLGLTPTKVFARSCKVQKLENKQKNEFLEANHIQGSCVSSINYGLFKNEELVAVMTFSKLRNGMSSKTETATHELIRFATKLNTTVTGGFSKLLKNICLLHPEIKEIKTFALRDWSKGNVYERNGFVFSHNSKPNYFYTKGEESFSRINFQKHKQKDKLKIFDETLTEKENMRKNGYRVYYDSGNKVYNLKQLAVLRQNNKKP